MASATRVISRPDGKTFYMTDGSTNHIAPIDLSDPRHPKELAYWTFPGASGFHGGSTSLDGKVGYQCEYTNPGSVRVLDLSGVQNRMSFALAEDTRADPATEQSVLPGNLLGELPRPPVPDPVRRALAGPLPANRDRHRSWPAETRTSTIRE